MNQSTSQLEEYQLGIQALLDLRNRLMTTICSRHRLSALEHNLQGHFSMLLNNPQNIDLTDVGQRQQNLCLFSLLPAFIQAPAAQAQTLIQAQALEPMADVLMAIDLIGLDRWQPVLTELVQHADLPETVRWALYANYAPVLPVVEVALPATLTDAAPGQLSVSLRGQSVTLDTALVMATPALALTEYQPDLYWLALHLLKAGHAQAIAFIRNWHEAIPDNQHPIQAMILSRAAEFTEPLQNRVRAEQLPARLLALHGNPAHLPFSLTLLDNPRFNIEGELLWRAITGRNLPLVPRLASVGGHAREGYLASVHQARTLAEGCDPDNPPQWLGKALTPAALINWAVENMGAESATALYALWLQTADDFPIRPCENHWQRRNLIQGLSV